jgi:hypothetical protein
MVMCATLLALFISMKVPKHVSNLALASTSILIQAQSQQSANSLVTMVSTLINQPQHVSPNAIHSSLGL